MSATGWVNTQQAITIAPEAALQGRGAIVHVHTRMYRNKERGLISPQQQLSGTRAAAAGD